MADPAKAKASTLSQIVLRNLGDRSYEKRKSAALEIESLIKELNQKAAQSTIPEQKEDELNKIRGAISMLVNNYAYSTQANYRKGGLIGLAATAIALMDDTQHYLPMLLPPVLKCFQDQEARVRYYACEALYNITKVARGHVLTYFNEIFDGLCTLYSDKEVDVKNGAQLLDRLLKDVVTESEAFDVEKFIPLLRERIRIKDPFIRQLIVGWITVLDSVPEIDILQFLPEYLSGLFDMLSDPNKDIRQQAYAALAEFLKEITSAVNVELGPMVMILVTQCESVDNFTRLTALTWMYEFIQLGQTKLLPFVASCLGACLHCISDSEEEIRIKAEATNNTLLALVDGTQERFDIPPVLMKLTTQVRNKWVPTRLASLRWIAMLLTKMPETIYKFLDDLFPALLATLSDPDEQVVRLDLEVLARISLNSANFDMVLHNVMKLFAADRKLLETRGSLIIRQLCCLLNGESIYRALAKILHPSNFSKDKDSSSSAPSASTPSAGGITPIASPSGSGVQQDVEFASLMVQTLNIILLTASELFELRSLLKQSLYTQQGRDLFVTLYTSWAHNPVATFSLCLLAQAYELASALAFQLADIEVTVGFLMQIDKLVQLIESPIFIHLRLQLLEPNQHPFLLKSLYGLLMLLPQSSAFTALKTRLESVAPLGSLTCIPDSKFAVSRNPAAKLQETKQLNFQDLLDQFKVTQQLHSQFRKEVFHQSSLLSATKEPEEKKSQK